MAVITHHDAAGSFRTFRGAASSPVGRLTVSSAQTIAGFGVDVDINGTSNPEFLIFNSDTGALLYQSASKAFADTGADYKSASACLACALSGTARQSDPAAVFGGTLPDGALCGRRSVSAQLSIVARRRIAATIAFIEAAFYGSRTELTPQLPRVHDLPITLDKLMSA